MSSAGDTTEVAVAPFGRRLAALAVDWIACLAITHGLLARVIDLTPEWVSFGPLLVLLVENVLLVGTGGATLGHRLAGLRVLPTHRPTLTPVSALVRAVLLCLALPPLLVGEDGRGMHDRVAGTTVVRD